MDNTPENIAQPPTDPSKRQLKKMQKQQQQSQAQPQQNGQTFTAKKNKDIGLGGVLLNAEALEAKRAKAERKKRRKAEEKRIQEEAARDASASAGGGNYNPQAPSYTPAGYLPQDTTQGPSYTRTGHYPQDTSQVPSYTQAGYYPEDTFQGPSYNQSGFRSQPPTGPSSTRNGVGNGVGLGNGVGNGIYPGGGIGKLNRKTPNVGGRRWARQQQATYSHDVQADWDNAVPETTYVPPPLPQEEDEDFNQQMNLLSQAVSGTELTQEIQLHELRNAPIFSANAKVLAEEGYEDTSKIFPQYGLFAASLGLVEGTVTSPLVMVRNKRDPRIFLNSNAPFSAFICGLQGSGKSHTLACMLENFIFRSPALGRLPNPLAGLVFHFDKYTSLSTVRPCEAAYLASELPIRVLVSSSNLSRMRKLYSQIPATHPPVVEPLKLRQSDLNIERMLSLMSVDQESKMPLYMETVRKILRDLAGTGGDDGLNYFKFKQMLDDSDLIPGQKSMLNLRLDILESFMDLGRTTQANLYETLPGTLTIVDLSDPFVDEGSACALFDICLGLFLEKGVKNGIVVALDEAHKYMSKSAASTEKFTDTLLSIIRQQRHLNARVLISTQEPTISPRLLDLCNMTIVHRFTSPEWLQFVRQHIAAAGKETLSKKVDADNLMKMIVGLSEGEAYVFTTTGLIASNEFANSDGGSSSSLLDEVSPEGGWGGVSVGTESEEPPTLMKLGLKVLKLKIRKRLTKDGGRSLLADGVWG